MRDYQNMVQHLLILSHLHLCSGGIPASASSMCIPQPVQSGLLQVSQVTLRHILSLTVIIISGNLIIEENFIPVLII